MMKGSRGMILLTTLIMLTLIALLLFSVMRGTWLYQKLVRQTQAAHTHFYALEEVAAYLETINFKQHSHSCLKKTRDLNQPVEFVRGQQGCVLQYKHEIYRYAVADLGVFACLKISAQASHHWMVAVTAPKRGHEILSVRVARPAGKRKKICSISSGINTGILSWRYLVD